MMGQEGDSLHESDFHFRTLQFAAAARFPTDFLSLSCFVRGAWLQIGSAVGSWASSRATSSPPTTQATTPPAWSASGTSTPHPSARS